MTVNVQEVLSAKSGKVFATVNGKVQELFYVCDIEATIIKNKKEYLTLGTRSTQYRTLSWKGNGKMTIYFITNLFRSMMNNYIKNGVDTYFDLQIVNDDPQNDTVTGQQTVVLRNVNLDSVLISQLSSTDTLLNETFSFTFEDVDYLQTLKG